jgi:hypothetical protein
MSKISVTFTNNTSLSINIETWQMIDNGLSQMKETTVNPGCTIVMDSQTGEWILNTYLYNQEMCNEWLNKEYETGEVIGKFRNTPCVEGKYSYMYNDNFQIIYNIDDCSAIFSFTNVPKNSSLS